jgi:AbrB family looped-hinge helix DNA binding protein
MEQEPEIAVVETKGQIVIPQKLRKELAITPNTKLCVYRKDDKLVVVKLKTPPLSELDEFFHEIDNENRGQQKPTEQEVLEEIKTHRKQKRANKTK